MRTGTCLTIAALAVFAAVPALAEPNGQNATRMLPTSAAAYGEYQGEVSEISKKPLGSANDLDRALSTFGGQNANQLSSGWISYSAMIAAQDKEFAESVRDIDAYFGRDRVVSGMRNDVAYARTLKGGERALQSALAANSQDASRISSAAAFVKDQAYKLQDVAWGKVRLRDAASEASRLKATAMTARPVTDSAMKLFTGPDLNLVLASAAAPAPSASGGSVWDKLSIITASAPAAALSSLAPAASSPATAMRVAPERVGTANRIVTLAAFHVLEAETTNQSDMKAAMMDRPTHDCIDWSQIQLRGCVEAASTRADLSFCLAEHAIADPGTCFSSVTR